MGEPDANTKVKVVDRRRFTAEGEEREPDVGAPAPSPTSPPAPAAADPASPEAAPAPPRQEPPPVGSPAGGAAGAAAPDSAPVGPGPGIADIVDLLAQQAMAFLSGQVPGRGRDPATARFFIDLIGVLKEKTTGRLTLEETSFLDDVLYQLRSLYVAATR